MKSYIRRIKLGVMITLLSLSVGRSQVSTAPHDMVWQVVASGSSLRSVYSIADGLRGWAVGENGTILATKDGGEHWAPQISSISNNLYGVAVAANGRLGCAVGEEWNCLYRRRMAAATGRLCGLARPPTTYTALILLPMDSVAGLSATTA